MGILERKTVVAPNTAPLPLLQDSKYRMFLMLKGHFMVKENLKLSRMSALVPFGNDKVSFGSSWKFRRSYHEKCCSFLNWQYQKCEMRQKVFLLTYMGPTLR